VACAGRSRAILIDVAAMRHWLLGAESQDLGA
jgi:hypothetical protein